MFVFSYHVGNIKKLLSLSLILCGAVILSVFILKLPTDRAAEAGMVISDETPQITDIASAAAYMESVGYTPDKDTFEVVNYRLPRKFDGVYGDYAYLQTLQGFDIMPYKGKSITRYRAMPEGDESRYLSILVYKGDVIGGDIFVMSEHPLITTYYRPQV